MRNIFLALVLANLAFAAWMLGSRRPSTAAVRPTNLPASRSSARCRPICAAAVSSRSPREVTVEDAASVATDVAPRRGRRADAAAAAGEERAGRRGARVAAPDLGAPASARFASSRRPRPPLRPCVPRAISRRSASPKATSGSAIGSTSRRSRPSRKRTRSLAKVREGVRERVSPTPMSFRNSDSGNLVSLGVFSEISGVSRLRDEVRALGYEPQVVDRTRRATVYWVDIALASDQTLDFDTLQTPGRIIRFEQRACETPG